MEGEDKDASKPDESAKEARYETKRDRSAAEGQENSWWGSWGKGWIDTVKEKSASTLEMVKKDLNEFVDVIQGDTSVAISETAEKLDQHVTHNEKESKEESKTNKALHTAEEYMTQGVKGLSQVLHSMSELMAIQQDPDDANEEFITLSEGSFSLQSYNRKQEKLQILQTDPGTYCNEPEGLFTEWLEVFSLDEHKEDMSNLLTQNPGIRAVYSRLVPNVISHTTFWQRYYYKVFMLDNEERRREELLARADKVNVDNEDDDGGWGDDDDDDIEVLTHDVKPTPPQSENVTPIKVEKDTIVGKIESVEKDVDVNDKFMSPPPQCIRNEEICNKKEIKTKENIEQTVQQSDSIVEKIETIENRNETKLLVKSCETIRDDNELFTDNIDKIDSAKKEIDSETSVTTTDIRNLPSRENDNDKPETSETGSLSSWMSIDDDIKVKKIKEEQVVKNDSRPSSDGSGSSGVLINKSEADDMDDDDFDIDLDDVDADEEEIAKMVEQIKNKSAAGDLQNEDDWENWE